MIIPPLKFKIMLESNPLKPRILVGRLAVHTPGEDQKIYDVYFKLKKEPDARARARATSARCARARLMYAQKAPNVPLP